LVRLNDPQALRAHQARFDLGRLPRDGMSSLDARRLEALLDRPYEELRDEEVAHALDLTARASATGSWFAYFLPATLKADPATDLALAERFLAGLLAARREPSSAPALDDWTPEVDDALERALCERPLRGPDDPVDLWLPDDAARLREIEAARRFRMPRRLGPGAASSWRDAREGPFYARVALLLLERRPAAAVGRLRSWETSPRDNLARVWVETLFHGHGVGWRADAPGVADFLDAPERGTRAEALLAHGQDDVAIGAAAVLRLLAPPRAEAARERVAARLAAVDARPCDRFVLTRSLRRLLRGD
jgi:hypothetical protein